MNKKIKDVQIHSFKSTKIPPHILKKYIEKIGTAVSFQSTIWHGVDVTIKVKRPAQLFLFHPLKETIGVQ